MRKLWLAIPIVALAAAGLLLAMRDRRGEWTTDSPEALAEFQKALDAQTKFYRNDAYHHLQRALELDPDFVAAKLEMQYFPELLGEKEAARYLDEVRAADLDRLNERERFIVTYRLSWRDGKREEASHILDEYLARHPRDPLALRYKVGRVWAERNYPEAERYYRQLLEVDPNWVLAHNHLGYIYMAQGRFDEAEKAFRTYRFIAPDQANPHDSLGELLTMLGRYEEARSELEEAVRIRPDFCASYAHLVDLASIQGTPEKAQAAVDQAERTGSCEHEMVEMLRCRTRAWAAAATGDWELAFTEASSEECPGGIGDVSVIRHRAAVETGRIAEAEELEQEYRDKLEYMRSEQRSDEKGVAAMVEHLEGTRLLATGDAAGAVDRFQKTDQALEYWGPDGQSIFKLYNGVRLARALEVAGRTDDAKAVLDRFRAVNPRFVQSTLDSPPDTRTPAGKAQATAAP